MSGLSPSPLSSPASTFHLQPPATTHLLGCLQEHATHAAPHSRPRSGPQAGWRQQQQHAAAACPLGMSTATTGGGLAAGFIICVGHTTHAARSMTSSNLMLPRAHEKAAERGGLRHLAGPHPTRQPGSTVLPASHPRLPPRFTHLYERVKGRARGALEGEAKHGIQHHIAPLSQRDLLHQRAARPVDRCLHGKTRVFRAQARCCCSPPVLGRPGGAPGCTPPGLLAGPERSQTGCPANGTA